MTSTPVQSQRVEFVRAISRLDATALVVGSMIGSGIFIVSADILRQVGTPGVLLLVWLLSGVVTLLGALTYGELAAMFPKAGGQYVYLREGISPLFGYLYGWTLFVVIQTGTIAAVAVAFARFTAVLFPALSPDVFLGGTIVFPQPIGAITVGLSPQRILAIASIAMVGSLFAMDAWNNVGFAGSELKDAKRDLPFAMAVGVLTVTALYLLANVAYLNVLPADAIATAPQDRVGTAALEAILGNAGLYIMAVAIMISTFGCNNGLILSGARVYYAMARDDLFFRSAGLLHPTYKTPAVALIVQAVWTSVLCLSGTYSQLLEFVIFAALVFYLITAVGLVALRARRPDLPRPVRAIGYPWLPALYVAATGLIALALLVEKTTYSGLGLLCVLIGVPVYFGWRAMVRRAA